MVAHHGSGDFSGDRERFFATTVPCPVCEGAGRWHTSDGSVCTTKDCGIPGMTCIYCDGRKRVIPTWRDL